MAWLAFMDAAPPAPRNSYLITVAVSRHLNPAGDLPPPPATPPAQPPSLFEPLDGVANCPPTAARVDGKGFIGGEAGAGLLISEAKCQLTPYQLVNGG